MIKIFSFDISQLMRKLRYQRLIVEWVKLMNTFGIYLLDFLVADTFSSLGG